MLPVIRPKSGKSQQLNVFSTKFLLLAIITVLGALNFFAVQRFKRRSSSYAASAPSISQLQSIPWDMQVAGLPVRPKICPRSYLMYEVIYKDPPPPPPHSPSFYSPKRRLRRHRHTGRQFCSISASNATCRPRIPPSAPRSDPRPQDPKDVSELSTTLIAFTNALHASSVPVSQPRLPAPHTPHPPPPARALRDARRPSCP